MNKANFQPRRSNGFVPEAPTAQSSATRAAVKLVPPGGNPVAPEEGAALVRAFVRLEQREVREAVIEFVTRLSDALARSRG